MKKENMMKKVIYLDMDGVLADFDKYYFNDRKSFLYEDFQNEVMNKHLFRQLPLMADYEYFISEVLDIADKNGFSVEICSSVHSLDPEMMNVAGGQKRWWLDNVAMLKSMPANFVERRSQKANYANENTILIDDSIECVSYFKEAKGNAIVHKDVPTTLFLLKKLIHEMNTK